MEENPGRGLHSPPRPRDPLPFLKVGPDSQKYDLCQVQRRHCGPWCPTTEAAALVKCMSNVTPLGRRTGIRQRKQGGGAASGQTWGRDRVWGRGCLLGVPLCYSLAPLDKTISFVSKPSRFAGPSSTSGTCQCRRTHHPCRCGHGSLSPKKT